MSDSNIADVVSTKLLNGEVRFAVGDSTDGSGIDHDVAPWGQDGFVSRPNDPDADGAPKVYYVFEGQEKRALGVVDRRSSARAGELAPGDRAIVSNCNARFFLKKQSDALTLFTTDADGKPLLFELNGSKGNCTVLITGASGGNALFQMSPGKIILGVDGGGSLVIDSQGVHVFGPHFAANTASGNLGVIGGVAPPLVPPTNAILKGPAGTAGTPSAGWVVV
jgi:hypothetical protein